MKNVCRTMLACVLGVLLLVMSFESSGRTLVAKAVAECYVVTAVACAVIPHRSDPQSPCHFDSEGNFGWRIDSSGACVPVE